MQRRTGGSMRRGQAQEPMTSLKRQSATGCNFVLPALPSRRFLEYQQRRHPLRLKQLTTARFESGIRTSWSTWRQSCDPSQRSNSPASTPHRNSFLGAAENSTRKEPHMGRSAVELVFSWWKAARPALFACQTLAACDEYADFEWIHDDTAATSERCHRDRDGSVYSAGRV
jgi:hypothetical protein